MSRHAVLDREGVLTLDLPEVSSGPDLGAGDEAWLVLQRRVMAVQASGPARVQAQAVVAILAEFLSRGEHPAASGTDREIEEPAAAGHRWLRGAAVFDHSGRPVHESLSGTAA